MKSINFNAALRKNAKERQVINTSFANLNINVKLFALKSIRLFATKELAIKLS